MSCLMGGFVDVMFDGRVCGCHVWWAGMWMSCLVGGFVDVMFDGRVCGCHV